MRSLSIVIPSKTASNLVACIRAIRVCGEHHRIIVVDDGLEHRPAGCEYIDGVKDFVFARNVNLGIRAAGDDDVLVLNDDALLMTRGGITVMQLALETNQQYGLMAGLCGGKKWQERGGIYDQPFMVAFVCALLPRRTINLVGLMDERFVHYGYCDDDYCVRVRQAGLKVATFLGCRVDHKALPSSYRAVTPRPPGIDLNRAIFCEKWGSHPL